VAHNVKVWPVRIREVDDLLAVEKVRGVAYRAVCSCGWRSPSRAKHREARALGLAHSSAHRAKTAGRPSV
jgi:uncharacterized protein YcbK (DUF882 family)